MYKYSIDCMIPKSNILEKNFNFYFFLLDYNFCTFIFTQYL